MKRKNPSGIKSSNAGKGGFFAKCIEWGIACKFSGSSLFRSFCTYKGCVVFNMYILKR